jgi:hypothetical protein
MPARVLAIYSGHTLCKSLGAGVNVELFVSRVALLLGQVPGNFAQLVDDLGFDPQLVQLLFQVNIICTYGAARMDSGKMRGCPLCFNKKQQKKRSQTGPTMNAKPKLIQVKRAKTAQVMQCRRKEIESIYIYFNIDNNTNLGLAIPFRVLYFCS